MTLELTGHIFFGKAVGLLKEVESQVVVCSEVPLAVKKTLTAGRLIRIASRMYVVWKDDKHDRYDCLINTELMTSSSYL